MPMRMLRIMAIVGGAISIFCCLWMANTFDLFLLGITVWTAVPFLATVPVTYIGQPSPARRWILSVLLGVPMIFAVLAYIQLTFGTQDSQSGLVFLFLPLWHVLYVVLIGLILGALQKVSSGLSKRRDPH